MDPWRSAFIQCPRPVAASSSRGGGANGARGQGYCPTVRISKSHIVPIGAIVKTAFQQKTLNRKMPSDLDKYVYHPNTTLFLVPADLTRQLEQLLRCEPISEEQVKTLCIKAREILIEEANVQVVDSPVTVNSSFPS